MNTLKYKEAIVNWVGEVNDRSHVAVTLTMKQTARHQKLDNYLATKNLRQFLNLLNRSIYGNAARRFNKRLEVLAVQEMSSWQRLHYHLLIKVPDRISVESLSETIQHHWKRTNFAYDENDVKPCYSSGWVRYMLKDISKKAELDIENTNISR